MIRTSVVMGLAVVLAGCPENGPDVVERPEIAPGATEVPEPDRQFAREAMLSGIAEVELSELAEQRAESEEVRLFAGRMVQDHTRANERLMSIVRDLNLEVPHELGPQDRQTLEKLSELEGQELDREYMQQMVEDHQEAVTLYDRQANQGMERDLRAFASDTLPVLREHLEMAREIHEGIGPRPTQ